MALVARWSSNAGNSHVTFGEDVVNELVDWFNHMDTTYRADLRDMNEVNFVRFDATLQQRLAEADTRWERHFAAFSSTCERRWAKFSSTWERRFADQDIKWERRFAESDSKWERQFSALSERMAAFEARIISGCS